MIFWIIGILFFAVTFVPRFFTFMNFGYGFSDLGLYSQFLNALSLNQFNPVIPTFGKKFLELKPEPILWLFAPLSHFTTSPTLFLFLDIFCLVIAAGVCAHVASVKLPSSPNREPFVNAFFFVILFAPLTIESLHAPSRVTVWAQAPLALLVGEYALQRRAPRLALWMIILCLTDLAFGALALVLVPLCLFTQMKRWNFQRRFSTAWPLGLIGATSLIWLKIIGLNISFEWDFFWATLGPDIIILLVSFWILPLLAVEYVLMAALLLGLKVPGSAHDVSLIFPLGAIAAIRTLEFLSLKENWIKGLVAAGFVATVVYLNLKTDDPFFAPWKAQHYQVLSDSKKIDDLLAQIPPEASVLASDILASHLTQHPNLMVIGAWAEREMVPDYVVALNQPTPFDHDRRYQNLDIPSDADKSVVIKSFGGARLLRRIK